MNRRRTDVLHVGESTLDVREQTVRETTEKSLTICWLDITNLQLNPVELIKTGPATGLS